jgi:hypothetical protein
MEITLRKWLESCLSLKYISNFSIIICIIAYYTQAYSIFFILAPLIITNLIIILLLEYNNLDTLVETIFHLENNSPDLESIKTQFVIFNTIWHILPVFWLYHIITKENIINLFKPNFMGIFLQSCSIGILYFYFGSSARIYGNINYTGYMVIYLVVLLGVCIWLYPPLVNY